MPEPIRPGIKKAVTPNIGITAFYIKSQQYSKRISHDRIVRILHQTKTIISMIVYVAKLSFDK